MLVHIHSFLLLKVQRILLLNFTSVVMAGGPGGHSLYKGIRGCAAGMVYVLSQSVME